MSFFCRVDEQTPPVARILLLLLLPFLNFTTVFSLSCFILFLSLCVSLTSFAENMIRISSRSLKGPFSQKSTTVNDMIFTFRDVPNVFNVDVKVGQLAKKRIKKTTRGKSKLATAVVNEKRRYTLNNQV